MALFKRRKKNTDVLPAEVQAYYKTERRERAGVAWLLALGTLIVTFAVAAILFFGGRWAYNGIFNKDKNSNDTKSTSQGDGPRIDDKGNVIGGTQSSPNTGTTTPDTTTPTTATHPTSSTATPAQLIDTGPGDDE